MQKFLDAIGSAFTSLAPFTRSLIAKHCLIATSLRLQQLRPFQQCISERRCFSTGWRDNTLVKMSLVLSPVGTYLTVTRPAPRSSRRRPVPTSPTAT